MGGDQDKGVRGRTVERLSPGTGEVERCDDELVVEEPLELRVAGETLMVTMRTPGEDQALAAGFLLAEGVISSLEDLSQLVHCGRPGEEGFGNVIDALPAPGMTWGVEDISRVHRGTLVSSACGVCGRATIEDLLERCEAMSVIPTLSAERLFSACLALRDHQPRFARTGAIHGAGIIDATGEFWNVAEDVGRHNAVDKVVGMELYRRRGSEAAEAFGVGLVVSGRVSFEIVQKAIAFKLPIVAGVSAPTSLAVDLADRFGVTVVGFARGAQMNVYTHPQRLSS